MRTYLTRHLQVLFATLGDMRRTPMPTINTLLIIAITLLLPCLLYVGVKSAQGLSQNWQGRPQITIFLNADINDNTAQLIFEEIQLHPAIELAEFISPDQALEEFRVLTGGEQDMLDQEIEFLGENPLPPSIVVMPVNESSESSRLQALKDELSSFDGIDSIRLDLDWTNRFNAMLSVATRVALLLSGLLGIALILIVGNTIKLLIFNRRHEVEIIKLVGGTDIFVRRPFLYYGTLFGLLGSLITLGLLLLASQLVAQPLQQLTSLYQSNALLHKMTALELISVVGIGSALGWLAARWSVAQHLRNIQPR